MLDSVYSLSGRFWQIAIGCAKRKLIERRAVRHWRAALFLFYALALGFKNGSPLLDQPPSRKSPEIGLEYARGGLVWVWTALN
jgi:hypothetical protein